MGFRIIAAPRGLSPQYAYRVGRTKETPRTAEQAGCFFKLSLGKPRVYLFMASSMATATETVAPTMGLLPMPIRPIISTWAGTEEEPAN